MIYVVMRKTIYSKDNNLIGMVAAYGDESDALMAAQHLNTAFQTPHQVYYTEAVQFYPKLKKE